MSKTSNITNYLLSNVNELSVFIKDNNFKTNNKCFKECIKDIFGINIPCSKYESVVSGEGNENEKINTVYSSSLQSLLIFANVSENKPIYIDGIKYTDSYFEYKNKVINRPSSIDVVLTNKEGYILFIESKLYEIVRDSNKIGSEVVGSSYFSNNDNGYYKKLGLELDEITKGLKIDCIINRESYGQKGASEIKKELGKDNVRIKSLSEDAYVYSYGIKQLLSHIIGIRNFISNNNQYANCSSYLNAKDFEHVIFISLHNELPGFDKYCQDKLQNSEDATTKLDDYKKHQKQVFGVLSSKNHLFEKEIMMSSKSYQDLYKENHKNNGYFEADDMKKIVQFYKLDKEQ